MTNSLATRALAILLTVSLVVPATFFFPESVSAQEYSDSYVYTESDMAAGAGGTAADNFGQGTGSGNSESGGGGGGGGGSCTGGLIGAAIGMAMTGVSVPNNSLVVNATTGFTAGSTIASCIHQLIIVPAARAAIRRILQGMTASVISFINGNNGSGQSSYVKDVAKHLRTLGDTVALTAVAGVVAGVMSPFSSAISSSLRISYAQGTSLNGFIAANKCTLALSSPSYSDRFLSGAWNQGGVASWFALTTQSNNNPYTLYMRAQAIAGAGGSMVVTAQNNRRQDLIQGGGFMSWCGVTETASGEAPSEENVWMAEEQYGVCRKNGGTYDQCTAAYKAYVNAPGGAASPAEATEEPEEDCDAEYPEVDGKRTEEVAEKYLSCVTRNANRETASPTDYQLNKSIAAAAGGVRGVSVGDPCTNKDGTPGTVKTPGSVIHDYTTKALVDSGFDQLISANDLDAALGAIMSAMLNRVVGGINEGLAGLTGSGNSSNTSTSFTSQLNNYASSNTDAANSAVRTANDVLSRIGLYTTAWQTIATSAQTASSSLVDLQNFCTAAAATARKDAALLQTNGATSAYVMALFAFATSSTAQAAEAESVRLGAVQTMLTQAARSISDAQASANLANKIKLEVTRTSSATGSSADIARIVTMPPTVIDLATVQETAVAAGGSIASPTGSLSVSRGTFVDQMNLIRSNAQALKVSACTAPTEASVAGRAGSSPLFW